MSGSSEVWEQRTVVLPATVDLHARPAGLLVRAAAGQDARIVLRSNGRQADASSILQVLALGATRGTKLEVEASGPDAAEALETIAGVIERFGEG
jgi:phosphotransferase system HPr (HPr) family protein